MITVRPKKKKLLWQDYFSSVQPELSGEQMKFKIVDITRDLRAKGIGFSENQNSEKVSVEEEKGKTYMWFNGYYDNKGVWREKK